MCQLPVWTSTPGDIMKRAHFRLMTVGAVGLLISMTMVAFADDAKEAAIKKDRKRIAGTWKIVSLEINGNKSSNEDASKLKVINDVDGSWSLHSEGNEVGRGTTTIDPTQTPKTIDIKSTTGQDQGKTMLGIYEVDKNKRKLCFAPAGQNRPTEFSSTAANQHILVKFERVKGKKEISSR